MTEGQKTVAIGAASGVAAMVALVALIYHILPAHPESFATLGDRLTFALQMNVIAVIPLFGMLATVGNERFLGKAIDPLLHKEDTKMEIDGRVADNTLQQNLVFLIGTLALSTVLAPEHVRVILALAIVFVIARLVFWAGYRMHPLYRAPGMAATAYMNLGILITVLYHMFF